VTLDITTPDGRRAFAFFAVWGGAVVFTAFAAVAVWLVSGNALYSLYLGLAAHVQVLVGLTAMGWAMGRRMELAGGKDGVTIKDSGNDVIREGDAVEVVKL